MLNPYHLHELQHKVAVAAVQLMAQPLQGAPHARILDLPQL
jgi:hypothetical protein